MGVEEEAQKTLLIRRKDGKTERYKNFFFSVQKKTTPERKMKSVQKGGTMFGDDSFMNVKGVD